MKKSLLSKLLAGVMSLGMITGGSSIQNVCAIEVEEVEWDNDDDYEFDYEVKVATPIGLSRKKRATCLAWDIVPFFGANYAHVKHGSPEEYLVASAASVACTISPILGNKLVLSEQDRKALDTMEENEQGKIVDKSTKNVVDNNKKNTYETAELKSIAATCGMPFAVSLCWMFYDGVQLIRGQ